MKKVIFTEKAPAPIGPYSQAILKGDTLYTSGQIAIDPNTGSLITETTFENVVKTTIFIMDMNDFAKINAVYASYFDEQTAPARETVQVACLPKNVNVEISMIAIR
mgnify:CR=1 FL=1